MSKIPELSAKEIDLLRQTEEVSFICQVYDKYDGYQILSEYFELFGPSSGWVVEGSSMSYIKNNGRWRVYYRATSGLSNS